MSASPPVELKKTPLNATHRASGARMVEFGGWDMPVEYSGITDEHLAVRTRAGIFDVSHMGEIELAGADALAAVQWLTTNDASRLSIGQAQVLGADDAGGDLRRRRARLPARDDALPARRQRREHRQDYAGSRQRSSRSAVTSRS